MTTIDTDANQSAVDDFNAEHGSVTWVRYWIGTCDDAPKYNLTDGKAWLLGGHTPVVRVRGESSCIALTHVDVLPAQPDGIEFDTHDLPEPGLAAERVGQYIAANGDGIYDVIDGHPLYARDMEALRRVGEQVAELALAHDLLDGTAKALGLDLDYAHVHHEVPAKVAELTAALAKSREQAATYANEVGSLTAENARVRQQRDDRDALIEAVSGYIGEDGEGESDTWSARELLAGRPTLEYPQAATR